jgi:hypothetical protein
MSDTPTSAIPRPPLAFRVGVTGARNLEPSAMERLRPAVAQILGLVARELTRLADDPEAQRAYRRACPGAPPVKLRLVSPLAEGSDRLVADESLKAGYALYAPLPFPRAEYEKDFPDSVEAFRALLERAEKLELDGARGELENESYQEVGRFVVRNCDLLIAIWDGGRERGPGGSAEIIRFAARTGLPVWWIDPRGESRPKLIEIPAHLQRPDLAPAGENAETLMKQYLEKIILPPLISDPTRTGIFGFAARHLSRLLAYDASPLVAYLNEKPLASGFPWRSYDWMMDMAAPKLDDETLSLGSAANRPENWWVKFYEPADEFSIGYGDRYRSSYVLIAILAFLALAAAALGSVLPKNLELFVGIFEICALVGIAALVLANHVHRWHERWISYRLLAELCRKQYVLSSIGQTLPGSEVVRLSLDAAEPREEGGAREKLPREAWVAWYFTAALRAAPFLTGSVAIEKPQALALARSLMSKQSIYHSARRNSDNAASRRIGQVGEICFLLTVVVGGIKLVSLLGGYATTIVWSAMLGACFTAASGAFVGIRAYSEFSLLVQQSTHMLRILREGRTELGAIDIDQPLAARDLGRAMYGLATAMMHDVSGWAQLFRIKTLETG